jgi:hypothetical protein
MRACRTGNLCAATQLARTIVGHTDSAGRLWLYASPQKVA